MYTIMKISVTGASGFIGSHLLPFLQAKGHAVFPHPRHSPLPEGFDVIINLAGEGVFGRWSDEKKAEIKESRLEMTKKLCREMLSQKHPPKLYISASAVGYYGDRGDTVLTEESGPGKGFLSEVCIEWEEASAVLDEFGIRRALCRFGMVLHKGGGALGKMLPPFKVGLGGKMGSGRQFVSWIALADLLAAIDHIITHTELSGPINCVSPQPVTNAELTRLFGKYLRKPTWFSTPAWLLNLLFGEGKEIFLSSARVLPKRLLDTGFVFQYPDLEKFIINNLEKKT